MTQLRKREYTLELVTPAFLGGAEQQSAEWRIPSIKALIRQWWRVVYVSKNGINVNEMRRQEGLLFGSTQEIPDDNHEKSLRRSAITIRFDGLPTTTTALVEPVARDREQSLPYLGFGPFVQPNRPTTRAALTERTKAKLQVIVKGRDALTADTMVTEVETVFSLIARFGTIGSRSRNGWGSLKVSGSLPTLDLHQYARSFEQCMSANWITGIAKDNSGLMIWKTTERSDWKAVMADLKFMRKELQNRYAKTIGQRPVINGPVRGNEERWPNQFTFKVLPENNGYVGQITLLAHQWPESSSLRIADLLRDVAKQLTAQNQHFRRITQ